MIAVLTFGLRIYSRRLHKNILDASDYTCLSGLVSSNEIYVYLEQRLTVIKVLDVGLVVTIWGGGLFYTGGLAASPIIFMGGFGLCVSILAWLEPRNSPLYSGRC